MGSRPDDFPVKSTSFTSAIGSDPADIYIAYYVDRILIVVTQLGTFGSILSARRDQVLGGGSTYHTEMLLGPRDNAMHELCARQLAEAAATAGVSTPLLICLSLKLNQEAIRELLSLLKARSVW